MWYCSECGKKNNGKFCTRCGTKYMEIAEDSPANAVGTPVEVSALVEKPAVTPVDHERNGEEPAWDVCNAAALFRRPANSPVKAAAESPNVSAMPEENSDLSGNVLTEQEEALEVSTEVPAVSEEETDILLSAAGASVETRPVPADLSAAPKEMAEEPAEDLGKAEEMLEEPVDVLEESEKISASLSESPKVAANPMESKSHWVAPFLREEETAIEEGGMDFLRPKASEDRPEPEKPLSVPSLQEETTLEEEVGIDAIPAEESANPPEPESSLSVPFLREEETPLKEDGGIDAIPAKTLADLPESESHWVAPFLREEGTTAEEERGMDFIRTEKKEVSPPAEEAASSDLSADHVFTHRLPPKKDEDKEWRYSKRVLIAVGAVGGAVFLALIVLIGSLFVNFRSDEGEALPESSGVYAYVSGAKATAPLYADKSINSDVLADLENGDTVEYLEKVNSEFVYVLDPDSAEYGYIRSIYLVADKDEVDYGNVDNQYDKEKSLGYYYVTKTENHLTLWENEEGSGVVKAKLKNGYKVSVLEKTSDRYWYVFDYTSAERGYVRTAYLTDDKSKVVGIYREPKDKTVIGELYVTGVKQYLPIWSEPNNSSKVRGKLLNGEKVGLIQKTTGSYWYVYGYSNGAYGWVSTAYLTSTPPAAPEPEPSPNYVVTGTREYLPIVSEAAFGATEVTQLHNGDAVQVLERTNDTFWYIVVPSTGVKGYVVKDYLTQ